MRRIGLAVVLALGLFVAPLEGQAQQSQPANLPRIGYLFLQPFSASAHPRDAFRQGLRELGYAEGQNIAIEFRNAEGRPERLLDLATELVRLKVDVIVAAPEASVEAAKHATKAIPLVMAVSFDPVGRGFVASLARPGGNITGLTIVSPDLSGKRMELLREMVPRLSRVGVLWEAENSGDAHQLKEMELAAQTLRLRLDLLSLPGPSPDFERANRPKRGRTGAPAGGQLSCIWTATPDRGRCGEEPCPDAGWVSRVCTGGRSDDLRGQSPRHASTSCRLCRQDSQGCEARRSTHRATDQIRSRHKHEDRQGPRPD